MAINRTRRALKIRWPLIAGGVVLLVALNAAVSVAIVHFLRPAVVTFGMKATVDAFFDGVSQKKLSEEQSQQLAARFTRTLDDTLQRYQQKHGVIILVTPAVVAGAPDITRDIQQQVAQRMREER